MHSEPFPSQENDTVAFALGLTEDVKKTLSAFANSNGGVVYFGVAADGTVLGIEAPNLLSDVIQISLKTDFHPSMTLICRSEVISAAGKSVFLLHVLEGSQCPYYVKLNGLQAAFVRQFNRTLKADYQALHRLIQKSNPLAFESQPSRKQNLTFNQLSSVISRHQPYLLSKLSRNFALTDRLGFNTNLAYWLADQFTSQTCVGIHNSEMLARVGQKRWLFSGSIFSQIDQIATFLETYLKTDLLLPNALWIILANLFIHKDYEVAADCFVNVFDDRIDFTTIGGLSAGIDFSVLRAGCNAVRNRKLSEALMLLGLIDHNGLGLVQLFDDYAKYGLTLKLIQTPNTIHLVLPLISSFPDLSGLENAVLRFIQQQSKDVSRSEIQDFFDISYYGANQVLNRLLQTFHISRVGNGPTTRYQYGNKSKT